MSRRHRYAAIAVVAMWLAACDAEPQHASPAGSRWHIDPAPVVLLGRTDSDPDYVFHTVHSVRFVGPDRLVTVDRGSPAVRVYDLQGRLAAHIGQTGYGPGEYRDPAGVWVRDDTVFVVDPTLRRVTGYRLDGTLLNTRQFAREGFVTGGVVGLFRDGGFAVMWNEQPEQPGPLVREQLTYARYDASGEYLGAFAHEPGSWFYAPHGGAAVPGVRPGFAAMNHPFTPRGHALIRSDTMFFTNGVQPVVSMRLADGRVVGMIPLPEHRLDYDRAMTAFRHERVARGASDAALARIDRAPRADSIPQYAAMLIDDEGLVWVKKYDPTSDPVGLDIRRYRSFHGGEWLVVRRDGGVQATVALPHRFIPMDVSGSLVAGISVDELEVERVVVYRIADRH